MSLPTANFHYFPGKVYVGDIIQFIDTSLGVPTSWSWDFGDGETSALQNPTHQYSTVGTYTVQLQVQNSSGTDLLNGRIITTTTGPPSSSLIIKGSR